MFFSKGDDQGKKHFIKEVLYGILKDNLKPTNEIIQTVAKNLEKLANSSHEVAQVVEDTEEVIKTSKFNLVTNLTSQEKQGS